MMAPPKHILSTAMANFRRSARFGQLYCLVLTIIGSLLIANYHGYLILSASRSDYIGLKAYLYGGIFFIALSIVFILLIQNRVIQTELALNNSSPFPAYASFKTLHTFNGAYYYATVYPDNTLAIPPSWELKFYGLKNFPPPTNGRVPIGLYYNKQTNIPLAICTDDEVYISYYSSSFRG